MLNRKALHLLTLFAVLMLPGVFFGNMVLVAMSLVPLCLLMLGLVFSPPRVISVEVGKLVSPAWAGDVSQASIDVRLSRGIGLVKLYQPLPAEFELVEGNNLFLHWQWFKPGIMKMTFKMRLAKRGRYSLPPLEWISQHPLALKEEQGSSGAHIDIEVWPRFYRPRTVKNLPGLSVSPFPSADIAKIGIPGQDFREIRKYVSGDPIKNINWRATARRAEQLVWPLVNEFEREGRKSVLIYLHASQGVEIGNTIENGLECSLEAAANLLFYYIERGYRTGIYICGRPPRYFYPDTGRVQFRKALRYLIDLQPGYQASELLSAVEATRDYVLGYNPLSVLITTLDTRSSRAVETAVHRIRQMYSCRRRPSIMVVGIDAYGLIPQQANAEGALPALMRLQTRPLVRRLSNYGANVVEWHPEKESFSSVFSRQVWVK
jgi:uncharacterized protein (DUF58 family)